MFFEEHCRTGVNGQRFGIRDDIENQPAYIDIECEERWGAEIINATGQALDFYALDNCLTLRNADNSIPSLCDAAIQTEKNELYFIELKNRASKGWRGKAMQQLRNTVELYRERQDEQQAAKITCCVCNSQKPRAPESNLSPKGSLRESWGVGCLCRPKLRCLQNDKSTRTNLHRH